MAIAKKTAAKAVPAKKTSANSAPVTTAAAKKAAVPAAPVKKAAETKTSKTVLKAQDVVFNVYSPESKTVAVAGEFNGWKPTKMKKGNDGVWTVKIAMTSGAYQYKFVFDGNWEIDQANPDRVPDGQGGENSVKNV
jgi:1,4-alpha-glucan branching enzyme